VLDVDARHPFKSLSEAQTALDQLASLDVKDDADVEDLRAFLGDCQRLAGGGSKKPDLPQVKSDVASPKPESNSYVPSSVALPVQFPLTPPPRPEWPEEKPKAHDQHVVGRWEQSEEAERPKARAPRRRGRVGAKHTWIAAGVITAMAAGVGLFAARQGFSPEPPAAPAIPIALPAVMPLPQLIETPSAAGPGLSTSAAAAQAATDEAPRIEPGWISVTAPFDMELYEQGKLLGTTGIDRIMLPAGRHDIEVVNQAIGYREARTVTVQPNRVAAMSITLPKGTISLNAIPWATVTIDGENAGDTPIGNLSLTIGPHEVVFTNPQLGEQRRVITVTQGSPVRFSIDLTRK
jgi:hypothetical protein